MLSIMGSFTLSVFSVLLIHRIGAEMVYVEGGEFNMGSTPIKGAKMTDGATKYTRKKVK